jgi:MFS family permease
MTSILAARRRRFVPAEYRSNFKHLYFDIAWFGVLNGSTLSFVAVYMARIGATGFHIGLFNASPAVITLLFALPAGYWLKNKSLDRSVFWSAALFRSFYLAWILFPILLTPETQIWAFVGFTLIMSIPGTMLAISFNALFADAVPAEYRAHVAGVRNALLAVSFILTSLLCGFLLVRLPFPLGYQVVFGIGFLGAVLSTVHLWFIHLAPGHHPRPRPGQSLGDQANPGMTRSLGDTIRTSVGLRYLTRRRQLKLPHLGILRGSYGKILFVLFLFHLSLLLPGPIYPLYWVNKLRLSDQVISLGNALFFVSVLIVSPQLSRLTMRADHRRILVLGGVVLSAYPTIMGLTRDVNMFLIDSVIGGVGWALAGGAVNNYLLEHIPVDDRPAYLSWYTLALNVATLISSLTGPIIAQALGLAQALLLVGGVRLFSSIVIWYWGKGEVVPVKATWR